MFIGLTGPYGPSTAIADWCIDIPGLPWCPGSSTTSSATATGRGSWLLMGGGGGWGRASPVACEALESTPPSGLAWPTSDGGAPSKGPLGRWEALALLLLAPPTPLWSFWPVSCLVPSCTDPSRISSQTAYDLSLASPQGPLGQAPPAWNRPRNGPTTTSAACWPSSIQPAPTGIPPSQPVAATPGGLLVDPTSYCPTLAITDPAVPSPPPVPREGTSLLCPLLRGILYRPRLSAGPVCSNPCNGDLPPISSSAAGSADAMSDMPACSLSAMTGVCNRQTRCQPKLTRERRFSWPHTQNSSKRSQHLHTQNGATHGSPNSPTRCQNKQNLHEKQRPW